MVLQERAAVLAIEGREEQQAATLAILDRIRERKIARIRADTKRKLFYLSDEFLAHNARYEERKELRAMHKALDKEIEEARAAVAVARANCWPRVYPAYSY